MEDVYAGEESKKPIKLKVIDFLRLSSGYDVMLDRNNIIVLDSMIPMNLAFEVMMFHNVDSCPLWDFQSAQHAGILTSTDVIRALSCQSQKLLEYNEIQKKTILYYKNIQNNATNQLILITSYPEENLYDIIKKIIEKKIHRIPLVDPSDHTVVGLLSQLDILSYLIQRSNLNLEELNIPIQKLNIGNYENIFTVKKTDTMSTVYQMMTSNLLTCIPIVDDNNQLWDIFSNFDIFFAFKSWTESINNFNAILETIVISNYKSSNRSKLKYFYQTDTLSEILRKFVDEKVTQLICVNDQNHPIGIISLTDILNYFLI